MAHKLLLNENQYFTRKNSSLDTSTYGSWLSCFFSMFQYYGLFFVHSFVELKVINKIYLQQCHVWHLTLHSFNILYRHYIHRGIHMSVDIDTVRHHELLVDDVEVYGRKKNEKNKKKIYLSIK